MILVWDLESDNLLEEATQVWCISMKDIDTDTMYSYTPDNIEEGIHHLSKADLLICHNEIKYDLPLLNKLHGFVYTGELFDTLVVSRLLNPDRVNPKGYVGVASHGLEAWGHRVGRGKPEHNDWSQFSQEMLHRNIEDVEINELVYYALLREMEL